MIAYLDDASRFVVGYGVFDQSTTYNALSVLDDCIARYGKPLEILTFTVVNSMQIPVKLKQAE